MHNQFTVITAAQVKKAIENNYHDIYNVIKNAYIHHGHGKSVNPPSSFLRFPDKPNSRIIALPAFLDDEHQAVGIKWIASNPHNINQQLPRASSVVITNDYETGFPKACLEGSLISATRTVVSAIIAAEHMPSSNDKCKNLGIIGNGFIAETLLNCLLTYGWPLETINLYDQNQERSVAFAKKFQDYDCVIHASMNALLPQSDLIVFLTTAQSPYVHTMEYLKHHPIILHISLRDLSPDIIVHSYNLVDDIAHILQANTSLHLAKKKYQTEHFVHAQMSQLLAGHCQFPNNMPIIFSPMGLGILDIALSDYILRYCNHNQLGIKIDNFFN